MKGPDLGRPDVMFLLVWAGTTWLAYEDLYWMTFDRSVPITLLIAFNIISFFVMHAWAARRAGAPAMAPPEDTTESGATLERWNLYLCAGWLALFVWIVFRSGGVPAWWRFSHIDRSYVDFGVPTVSGFANMLRSFLLCLSVLLWLRRRSRTALAVASIVLTSSLLEMARANVVYLLLCGLGVYLVHRRPGAKALALMAGLAIAFVLAFGLAEEYRSPGGSGGEKILEYPSVLNRLPYGVTSVYLYLTTPVSNLYYAEARGIQPLYAPYYSLELILPTVLRSRLYTAHDYPIAVRRVSHNATTFYAPLIADFGIVAAGLLVCLLQYVISHVHVRAVRGEPYYQLVYGPLFASVALSFFFNYFLTLGVLLFPLVALLARRSPGVRGERR
ncbi:MAG: O-antigen polymerase [Acidobacteriota bacterium]